MRNLTKGRKSLQMWQVPDLRRDQSNSNSAEGSEASRTREYADKRRTQLSRGFFLRHFLTMSHVGRNTQARLPDIASEISDLRNSIKPAGRNPRRVFAFRQRFANRGPSPPDRALITPRPYMLSVA